jgi:hypothetical protein
MLPGISLFDAWGFNRGSRILVFLVDLVLLFLAVQPVGLSARVRTGWLPACSGLLVGVFWEKPMHLVVGPGAWLFVIGGSLESHRRSADAARPGAAGSGTARVVTGNVTLGTPRASSAERVPASRRGTRGVDDPCYTRAGPRVHASARRPPART